MSLGNGCKCVCICGDLTTNYCVNGCLCLAVERLKIVMEDIECQISAIRDQQKLE